MARLREKDLGPGSCLRMHRELALAPPRIADATDPSRTGRILEVLQDFGEVGRVEGVRGRGEKLRGWWSEPRNRVMAGVAAAVVLVTLSLLAELVAGLRGGRQVADTGEAPLEATLAHHRLEAALVAVKCGRHSSLGFYVEPDVIATIGQALCPAGRKMQVYNAIRGNLAATTTYRDDLLDLDFLDAAETGVPLRALDVESIAQGDVVYPGVLTRA